jgi:hypothetical protein
MKENVKMGTISSYKSTKNNGHLVFIETQRDVPTEDKRFILKPKGDRIKVWNAEAVPENKIGTQIDISQLNISIEKFLDQKSGIIKQSLVGR